MMSDIEAGNQESVTAAEQKSGNQAEVEGALLARLEAGLRMRPRRVLPSRGQEAAVLVALTDEPDDPEVILTRRHARLRQHGGEVAFPGGKRELGDGDLEATALREAEEETALAASLVRVLGPLDEVVSKHGLRVVPYLGVVPAALKLVPDPVEIETIFQVPLRFFLADPREHTDRLDDRGQALYVPSYRYDNHCIWGLTAYVLVELLNRGLQAGIPLYPTG